jgi:hypothetical protein
MRTARRRPPGDSTPPTTPSTSLHPTLRLYLLTVRPRHTISTTDYRTTFLLESDFEDYTWEHIVLSPEPARMMAPYRPLS